jgi:hypothetical protein
MLRSINLSQPNNVAAYLQRCRLPHDSFTAYVLKKTLQEHYSKTLRNMSVAQIHQQGYCRQIQNKAVIHQALLATLFPYVEKDVEVMEYHLNHPISAKEIRDKMVSSTLDLSRVPKEQQELVNAKQNTMLDVITLQDMPLSDFVQVLETGELLSRETLEDLIRRNTTTWRGKESVGFKTPEGAILGHLVSYNFDQQDFFPQKPGTLSLSRIRNVDKIPSQLHPTKVVPTHFFRLQYMNHVSYLPDTKEGRIVLGLFKDAFKKGNLYGLSYSGRVRHGRVHKKTTLTGSSFGYPDETYLQRVSGELRALGSTPFLYQFSQDPTYEPKKDPYPDEKRFRIEFL